MLDGSIRSSALFSGLMWPPAYLPSIWTWPSSFMSTRRNPRASLIFSDRTQAVLYCAPSSRERCSAAFPLTAFTDIQIADKHLPEAELVEGEHGAGGD